MAEEAMKKLRDEVALRLYVAWFEALCHSGQPYVAGDGSAVAEICFRFAEAFLAARYAADMGKLKDKPPP